MLPYSILRKKIGYNFCVLSRHNGFAAENVGAMRDNCGNDVLLP